MPNEFLSTQAGQVQFSGTDQPTPPQSGVSRGLLKTKISYRIGITLLSFAFLANGMMEVIRNPQALALTTKLGYPPCFMVLLGIAKITGIAVLLIPNNLHRFKEWVFAGLVFDMIFAFASTYEMGTPADCVKPVIAFTVILITYVMFRRIHPPLKVSI